MPIGKCMVDDCKTGDTLFRTPRSPILRCIWRKILSLYCKDIDDDCFVNKKVCILHFEPRYYVENPGKKKRRTLAFPTLFTREEIASGVSALGEVLNKLEKFKEEWVATDLTDHTYIPRQNKTYLAAEISKYIDKHYEHQVTSKDCEGPDDGRNIADENTNKSTINGFISENQDDSQIISQRLEDKIYGKNSANYNRNIDYDSTSNDKFEKQDGSQINSKRREDRNYGKNNTDGNNCTSTSERNSATEHYSDTTHKLPGYSYNLSAPNVIQVITHKPEEPAPELVETSITDVTEYETCITDATEYGFDGDNFDDEIPIAPEPIPDVPEALFSWEKELNLFPLDDVVNVDDDAVCPDAAGGAGRAAPEPSLYDPSAPEEALDADYQCDECQKEITGFRYTCVQCADWDVCGACEARAAHAAHYLLRIPSPRPYNEIQTVLAAIRRQLLSENLFLPQEFTDDWLAEVKDEPEAGERGAGEHTRIDESNSCEESDVETSPPSKRPRLELGPEHDDEHDDDHDEEHNDEHDAELDAEHHVEHDDVAITTPPVSPQKAAATEHIYLTDDVLDNSSENEIFSPGLSVTIPASLQPVSSTSTEIHKNLTETLWTAKEATTVLTSMNPPQVLKKHSINLLARKHGRRATPPLKPSKKPETLPIDPSITDEVVRCPDTPIDVPMFDRYYIFSSKCSHLHHNPIKHHTNTITQTGKHDDNVPTITKVDPVKMSLGQTNKKPTLTARPQRPDATSLTRSQFFDEGFDDNLPITVEDDQDNPADVPLKSQLITKICHNSPTRMDVDASSTRQRITRSKQWSNNMPTVDDKPVQHTNKLKYIDEALLETIGGTQTIDQLINEDDIIILITEADDTSRLTEESQTAGDSHLPTCPPNSTVETSGGRWESPQPAVLRVAPGSNEADLRRALQCPAFVQLERSSLLHRKILI